MGMGFPSSQGDKKPTIIKTPPKTRAKDTPMSGNIGNGGPKYGGEVKKGG